MRPVLEKFPREDGEGKQRNLVVIEMLPKGDFLLAVLWGTQAKSLRTPLSVNLV